MSLRWSRILLERNYKQKQSIFRLELKTRARDFRTEIIK